MADLDKTSEVNRDARQTHYNPASILMYDFSPLVYERLA
jgi:hypothetical protein